MLTTQAQKLSSEGNAEFYRRLFKLTLPMAIQQLLMSSLFIIDTIIVSSLGDAYIAAVGQANQISLLMWCAFFAISSGGSIFAAQYWGKNKDADGVHRAFTASMLFGGVVALLFFIIAIFFNRQAMGLLTRDPAVIDIGCRYIQIAGFAYLVQVLSAMLSSVLRATDNTRIPMISSVIAVLVNIFLDIALVYGMWGFPRMEVEGAALATVIACLLDIIVMVVLARIAKTTTALRRSDFVPIGKDFLRQFIKVTAPVLMKDVLWALGVVMYSITFAYMGTAALAAYNVFSTMGGVVNIFFISVGSAGGILIGHLLGAKEIEKAKSYAWKLLRLMLITGILFCPILLFGRSILLMPFPNLSSEAISFAMQALLMMSFVIWAKGINFTNMDGILRSGGDTIAAAIIEIGVLWGVGVFLTMMAGLVFHLPFWQVFAMVCLEELVKSVIGTLRVRKYKWAKTLV
jgi:putative MATE family efflux protein